MDFVHGVFAAVASAPTHSDVTDWLPRIVGDNLPDQAALERVFALVMRDFHACAECLTLGVPAVPQPSDADAIASYCKGYVQVSQADARWKADTGAFTLTMPLAVLSGYVSPDSLRALEPELAADPDGFRARYREQLSETVSQLYKYWAPARAVVINTLSSGGKVGRNELCPCHSGKKFKRCCGAS